MNTTLRPHLRRSPRRKFAGRGHAAACVSVLLALFASAASADWLVTGEGARIETKGPWQIKGRLIVFTTADGKLSSMRASEVDLDASAAATAEAVAKADAPPAPPPKVEAKHVFTNADIGEGRPRAVAPSADGAAPADDPDAFKNLLVESWEVQYPSDFNGLAVVGQLKNIGSNYIGRLQVTIRILDQDGVTELASGAAFLGVEALPPGQATDFRLPVEGVAFAPNVDIRPRGTELLLEVQAKEKNESDDSEDQNQE